MSVHMPRVSIGLAVYNGERFIAYVIESALNRVARQHALRMRLKHP